MAQNVSTYIKNVGKSFGYVMGDIMKQYNPVISSIAEETKYTAENLYDSIKPFVSSKPDINEKKFSGTIKNTIDDSIRNVFDDLKTGNLYNRARKNASDEAIAKSLGFDLDFDFDFDDDWGDLDDDEDDNTSAKAIIASNDTSTKEIIGAVDQVGYKVADALGTVTVESADYIVKSSKQDNRAMYALNRRGFSQVTQALLSVNSSIASFSQIGEPLSAHMQNSSVFFTRTTETLNRMDQTLQQIAKNTTPAPSATNGNYNLAKGTLADVMTGDGFSLSSYKDMVKNNLNDYKDMVSMLTDTIKGMKDDSSGSYGKNLSLLGMGTKFVMEQMIPKVLKESMKDLNEGIKNFIGAGLVKARNTTSNSLIVELIKDVFLPKDGRKMHINTANYNKGQVAWDGIARKALTEVIPEYLSGIYKILSGKDKVYDYDRGNFKDRETVKNDSEKDKRNAARRAGGDFRDDLNSSIDSLKDATNEYKEKMKKEIDDYFYNSFTKGGEFWNVRNFSDSDKKRYGVSDDAVSIILNKIEEYNKTSGKRNRANKSVVDMQNAINDFGNSKRREEASGTSNEVYLRNGFSDNIKDSSKEGLTDKYQQPMLFYLAGIYQNTGYLADNIGYISGNSSIINNSRSRIKNGEKVDTIAAPKEDKKETNSSTGGEKTISDTIKEYQNSNDESLLDELRENLDEDEINDIRREKLKKQGKEKTSGWKDKMKGFADKFTPKALKSKFDKPFEAAANILDSINITMTHVIWGKNGDPNDEDGFLGYLMKSTKETFNKFNDKVDEMFPDLKKKLSKFWDTLFGAKGDDGKRHGGKLGEFRDQTRDELRNTASWMGQTVKNFFRSGKPKKSSDDQYIGFGNIDNAAYGRQVTKTGIVAVSEGEMIIPSELNPFYHGSTNKRDQVRKEKNAISKFYGAFEKGTTSVGDKESDKKGLKESISDYLKNKVESSKNSKRDGEGKGHEFIRQGFETLGSGFAEFFQRIGGNNDQKEIEKEKKALNEKAATLLKEAGANKGAIGAGAVIGGGVSLLTGAVVGPLFGAAIGGAVGLALKSEQTQKILFGDDEGNKGLLPKKVGDFIKKQLPDVGAGTAIGAAGGLFMGSPVLGAVLGGTVGYVKSSENAQNFLFGKKDDKGDRTGGLISKQLQNKIKKAVPGISAGMIAGAVVGPFGLVGNLMVGAGVGYLATSHNFHSWMFGEDGQGGFVEKFKTKIFDNIDIISRNMWNAFKARSRNLFKSLGEKVQDFFTKKARAAADGTGGGLIGKALNLGNKVINGTTDKIGNFLDRKRSKIVGRNLAKGYEVYDWVEDENGNRVKKTLSAAERFARRGGNSNNSSINNFDKLIAGANSKEELVELQKQLADLRKPKRALSRSRNEVMTGLYSGLGDLDKKNASKIGKLVSKGKYDQALGMIDRLGLNDETSSKYKEAINSAKSGLEKANDVKGAKNDIINKLKAQGIDATKAGQLENMQDYISEEIKQRFSDEKVAENKEEEYKSKISTFLESIRENTEIIASGKTKKLDSNITSAKDIVDEYKETPQNSLTLLQQLYQELEDDETSASSAVEKVKEAASGTTITAFGDTIKTTTNSQGEQVPDLRDAATKESLQTTSDMKAGFKAIPVIGTAVGAMQGFFGSIKDKIFGDEQKPGLLGTIKNLLSGEAGGPLSYLFNFLSGTKIGTVGKALKSAVSKITLGGVLTEVVAPALLLIALSGKFDKLFEKFGFGSNDKESDIIYNKDTGEQYTKDENGNYIDSEGNIVDTSNVDIGVRSGSTKSFSESLQYNTVRGALTGTKSVASKVLGKTALGKGVSGLTSTLGDAASSFIDADTWKLSKLANKNINGTMKNKIASAASDQVEAIANKAARAQVQSSISDVLSGAVSKLKKLPMLKNVDLDGMAADLSEKISQKVVSSGGKNLMNTLAHVAVFAKVAFAVIDFTTGYEDARSTLGITSKPTVGQKILSGILRVVKNCIPVIGTLIPDNVVIDVCCDYIAPALGIDVSELKESREKAQEEVDAYNAENGTNYSIQEYNKSVLKDYTWTERIGNAAKSTVEDTKNKWSNFKNSVKENGLGGTIKNSFKNDVDTFKESFSNSGGGIFGAAAALGDTLGSKLPGIFGEAISKNADIVKYANKGELGDMWKVALSDFSSDASKGEADVSVFSKVIGQIPLITTKIAFTPIALIKKAGNAIANFFKPVTDGIQYITSLPSIVEQDGEALLLNSDSTVQEFLDVSKYERPDSIFNGLVKGVSLVSRIVSYPILMVKNFGNKVKTGFENFVQPIKNSISVLGTNIDNLDNFRSQGDVSGLLEATMEDDPNNPVGGFTKGLFVASKITHFIPTCVSWLGHTIADGVTELIGKSKSNYETTSKSIETLKEYAADGDISSIWKEQLKLEPLDPLSNIWKVMFQFSKILQVVSGAFNKFVGPIIEGISEFKDMIGDGVSGLIEKAKEKLSNAANKKYEEAKANVQATSGAGSGMNTFVSQYDSKYKDMAYAGSTVSEKGCAPAVASMVASNYGLKYGMDKAIKDSANYQNDEGTSSDYFKTALGGQGISTSYIQGANTAQQVTQALANGNQVILLGKDANNTSKDNSPFGPTAHYVVATGLDKNGNLIINDPEADAPRTYSTSILSSANMGISTDSSSGSGGTYDTDIARKTWGYFTSHGYSPEATAGIMGNMYQESGMDPTRHQNGGPAAGIVQWEKYGVDGTRWAQMQEYANKNGYNWDDLDPQLQYVDYETTNTLESYWKNTSFSSVDDFKNASDPMKATEGFEKSFERANPDKCNMPRRKEAAEAYYQLYQDSSYTGNYTADDPSGEVNSVSGSSDSSSSSGSTGFAGILSAISSAFSKIGSIFTGSSDDSSSSSSTSSTSSTGSSNITLGDVPSGKGNSAQKKIVQYAESILGRDQYSQDASLRTQVGQGYSDCSSFAQWAYKNAIGVDPGGNTGAIIDSPLLTTVDEGSTPNTDNLEAGDLMLFRSKDANGRTKNVGHVEIYDGNGNVIGHGSGIGPTKKSLQSYLNTRNSMGAPYIETRRYSDIASLGDSSSDSTTSTSGTVTGTSTTLTNGGMTMSAAGSGLSRGSAGVLLSKKPSFRNKNRLTKSVLASQGLRFNKSNRFNISGSGSDITSQTTEMLNNVKSQVTNSSSGISSDLVQKLLESITNVLNMIANNTAPIEQIYKVLAAYTNNSAAETAAVTTAATQATNSNNDSSSNEVSDNISNLVGVLGEIARG